MTITGSANEPIFNSAFDHTGKRLPTAASSFTAQHFPKLKIKRSFAVLITRPLSPGPNDPLGLFHINMLMTTALPKTVPRPLVLVVQFDFLSYPSTASLNKPHMLTVFRNKHDTQW